MFSFVLPHCLGLLLVLVNSRCHGMLNSIQPSHGQQKSTDNNFHLSIKTLYIYILPARASNSSNDWKIIHLSSTSHVNIVIFLLLCLCVCVCACVIIASKYNILTSMVMVFVIPKQEMLSPTWMSSDESWMDRWLNDGGLSRGVCIRLYFSLSSFSSLGSFVNRLFCHDEHTYTQIHTNNINYWLIKSVLKV